MKNYRIYIQYDGGRYKGWQNQKSTTETIQGKLMHVLETLTNHPVEVIGSGRTDAGVHAKAQVANFHIEDTYSKEEIFQWLNRYLPEDICVYKIEEVEERFHSRYLAKEKTYQYRIWTSEISNVFERKYVYTYLDAKLDVEKMKAAAKRLVGEHDFRSFCGNKNMKKSTVRCIKEIKIEEKEQEIVIEVTGDGFLQNMVRIITGTLIEVGNKTKTPESVTEILEKKDRKEAGYTVPAQGLCLQRVIY